jgi:hypothetical protein
MDPRESSSLNFLPVLATFRHRPARCELTEPSWEDEFTNACSVWTN